MHCVYCNMISCLFLVYRVLYSLQCTLIVPLSRLMMPTLIMTHSKLVRRHNNIFYFSICIDSSHQGRSTRSCVSEGIHHWFRLRFEPVQCEAMLWINNEILSINTQVHIPNKLYFNKMHLTTSFAKFRQFWSGFYMLSNLQIKQAIWVTCKLQRRISFSRPIQWTAVI